MNIILRRKYFNSEYTIGQLFVNGKRLCDTLEPPSRGLKANAKPYQVKAAKKNGPCCIPYGNYVVVVTKSPRFKKWLPLLIGVTGFEGVRIHAGNYPTDTKGCILPGWNTSKGIVSGSQQAMNEIMNVLTKAYALGKSVHLIITKG